MCCILYKCFSLLIPTRRILPSRSTRHSVSYPSAGEDDNDPLLDNREVNMRAVMVAGGLMEFELLRLPLQSKTVGPSSKTVGLWTFQ